MTTWYERLAGSRLPDFVIGGKQNPYMERWWVIPRNRFFNIYLHRFWHSDDDRALHDHPWVNVSILLKGDYIEHTIPQGGVNVATRYVAGAWKFRRAKAAHRIEITQPPVWSLFVTGPVIREWGFHCPAGWRPWQIFVRDGQKGEIGRGCE